MKILLIGDAGSIWVAKYVEEVIVRFGHKVTVWSERDVPVPLERYYRGRGVRVRVKRPPSRFLFVRRVSSRFRTFRNSHMGRRFDLIHVQFASIGSVRLALQMNGRRIVISYWGSDLLRRTREDLVRMQPFLERAAAVTVNSVRMREAFLKNYGGSGVRPILTPFGISGIGAIDDCLKTASREDCAARFEFPPEKVIIVAGHNGRREQQHMMMLDAISGLEPHLRERLHLVLPMTYGRNDQEYIEEVRLALGRTGCTWNVLTEFLPEEGQACLAVATDIFIHAQTTDAISATLQEFLYAGATVLNGSWLEYPELTDAGAVLHGFGNQSELVEQLGSLIPGHPKSAGSGRQNHEAMKSRSWEAVAGQWEAVYRMVGER